MLYAAFAAAKPILLGTRWFEIVPATAILVPVLFVALHGPREIGWKLLGLFFLIAFGVSWSYETASILTGFPFGDYHYTEKLGPKLGDVPLLIMPAYFGVCYISWIIAKLLLTAGSERDVGILPRVLVASFVMVMWDLAMDPSRATVAKVWIWHEGGSYFGVPLQNFAGWYLCVATILLIYGLIERQVGTVRPSPDRTAYAQALALYAGIFLEFVAFAFLPPAGAAFDATGKSWDLVSVYQTLGLVATFTMGFVILLGMPALTRREAETGREVAR
jgi:putative membrane protein